VANASISASVVISNDPQRDGRAWIRERHTDNLGLTHDVLYLWHSTTDPALATLLTTHAANLAASLQAGEIAANVALVEQLGAAAVYSTNYSTQAENDLAVRQAFLTAAGALAITIGAFLNTIGAARLTVAFSLGNIVSLQALLSTLNGNANTVNAARGQ
jgi:hypothetical protein